MRGELSDMCEERALGAADGQECGFEIDSAMAMWRCLSGARTKAVHQERDEPAGPSLPVRCIGRGIDPG